MKNQSVLLHSVVTSIVFGALLATLMIGSANAASSYQTLPTATPATDTTTTPAVGTTATVDTTTTPATGTTATVGTTTTPATGTTATVGTTTTPAVGTTATVLTGTATPAPSTLPSTGGSDSTWLIIALVGIIMIVGAFLLVNNQKNASNR